MLPGASKQRIRSATVDVSIWGEAVPNWIAAGAAALALVIAGIAGKWAKSAAESAADQAAQTRSEVQIAEQQLQLAQRELTRAQVDAAETARVVAETRIDALAPEVYAWAQAGGRVYEDPEGLMAPPRPLLSYRRRSDGEWTEWLAVHQTIRIEGADLDNVQFRIVAWLNFQNVSDRVARIVIENPGWGSVEREAQEEFILLPGGVERGQKADTVWTLERSAAWVMGDGADHPPGEIFLDITFAVRDLGSNSCDKFKFVGDLRFFERDGSRLIVEPKPSYPWLIRPAAFVGREYEALIRAAAGRGNPPL